MKQLAICIPIYNQPEMLREMFIRCLSIYDEFGIDVYIYDSSPDNKTENVIQEYRTTYQNLYYKHLSTDIQSNIKVVEAYKEIIGTKKYEYLWLCPDYIQLTRQGVECVLEHCRKGFDICVLNYRDVEHIGEKRYTDINTFFLDCAWHMTSYMATIIRLASFADVEWEEFYKRYMISGRILLSHVALYFEQLAKLPKTKAIHVPVTAVHLRISSYRKESLWKKEVFPIWCDYWPDMIYALPERYQNKDAAIKKLGVNTGILSWDNFKALRRENIYDLHVFNSYRNKWKKLTNIPCGFLWMLAVMPSKMVVILKRPSLKQILLNRRLKRFCRSHRDIFIYGCGFMAEKTSLLLDRLHIKFLGYIVSDLSSEKQSFRGLPVMEYGQLPVPDPKTGIIVALSKTNTVQVMDQKQELALYNIFYMHPYEKVLG